MKVIVVSNPFEAMLVELLFGHKVGGEGGGGTPLGVQDAPKVEAPDLKANPDFYTKPDVPKALILKVKSNTEPGKMYEVSQDREGNPYCTCMGFKYRGKCSHITRVMDAAKRKLTGLGACLHCGNFSRDERDFPRRQACAAQYAIICPPKLGCRFFQGIPSSTVKYTTTRTAKPMPMTFPVEGALLQTFQSRHFPETQYEVKLRPEGELRCTCRGFNFHGTCKHVQYMKQHVNQGSISI